MLRSLTKINPARVADKVVASYRPLKSLRRMSNFSDRLKQEAEKLVQKGTNAATEAIKKGSDAAVDAVQTNAKRLSDAVKEEASKTLKRGSEAASQALESGSKSAMDAVHSTSGKVSKQVQSTTKAATDASYRKASEAGQAAVESSKAAVDATTERVQQSTAGMLMNGQEMAKKMLRSLWWWSLAAIAVYGVATTVPKEIIRYGLSGSTKKIQEQPAQPIQQEEKSSENGGLMSIFLGSTKESNDEPAKTENENTGWKLPWLGGASSDK